MIASEDIRFIGQFIINELGAELIKQQHRATGELIASLDYRAKNNNTTLEILMNDYGAYVNRGRRAGGKKVPIQALVDWIKVKGIETNNKKAVSIAFAIQKTIEKEGIPTRNSRKRGKRTGFVDDTLVRISNELNKLFLEATSKQVEIQIDNLVKEWQ